MRLLKIILVFFLIYFIRRFIQMYRVMKSIQEQQLAQAARAQEQQHQPSPKNDTIINADFKVVD
jgi:hypothetical protein